MKKFLGRLALAAGTVAVACCVASAALANDFERPMRSRTEVISDPAVYGDDCWDGHPFGDVCWVFLPDFPLCFVTTETGNSTHLGRYTGAACTYIIDFDLGTKIATIFSTGADTAANGDKLFFSGTGTIDLDSDPVVGEFTSAFDGGTGRFTNAVGLVACEGIGDAQSCVGTIAY